jgi:hypothetical protein
MLLKDVPLNSVIEHENKIYLVVTHCDEITGWRTCYPITHTKRKEVRYNPYNFRRFDSDEEVTLLTSTFERFCNLYEMYGKV